MRVFFRRHAVLHIWLLCALLAAAAFHLSKENRALMNALAEHVTGPVKETLGALCAEVPFSVAEVALFTAAGIVLLYLGALVGGLIRCRRRGNLLYTRLLGLVCAGVTVYSLFCLLWGVNYYTDGFQERSGLRAKEVSIEELQATTTYFAQKLNETSASVKRDEAGVFDADRSAIYDDAVQVYRGVEQKYPFLALRDHRPKRVSFSKLMSRTNFTGFFFPFTGEANLNDDSPACLLPATIAHEMAHQRGIASEDECNFLAVLTCAMSGNAVYEYSGYLMGFIHLSNALYQADPARWEAVHAGLNAQVRADLADNNGYWARFESETAELSQSVYDGFLKSYGEESGIQSYGEVVDLLVAYYGPQA